MGEATPTHRTIPGDVTQRVWRPELNPENPPIESKATPCYRCGGLGRRGAFRCSRCNGSGRVVPCPGCGRIPIKGLSGFDSDVCSRCGGSGVVAS